ncbi:transcription antitermination factor NusB [Clostridium tetanomorphum]|uniref:Transcription antitermination protein NusB n=1 Tax=Clostridium tetanomorphum TaxID=1553 RepID=A0A923E512_CLOTT|nr:transcription antitermination factor NusB [Clostridium tetanomorphum]MBC2396572.1 transcription antitermination factor NusB [Clostridium tetanomorphum]NRZ98194.1 N utilization substance protein B [Clostridium tetanomorphum]
MNRTKTREVTMKLLFEMIIKKEEYINILEDLKEANKEEENVTELMGIEKEKDPESTDLDEVDMGYIIRLLKGIQDNEKKIDETIEKYLSNWKLNRLAKVDLAILRLATYEILFEENIPNKVSINEAVELAKKYGEDKSPAFINAVLDKIVKEQ